MSASKRSTKRKTTHVTLWVKPELKAELQRQAQEEGLSVSLFGGTLLEKAIHQELHTKHAALTQPLFDNAVKKYTAKLALLLARIAFTTEHNKQIDQNILSYLPNMEEPTARDVVNRSADKAMRNIRRKTPQMEQILKDIEKWLTEEKPNA